MKAKFDECEIVSSVTLICRWPKLPESLISVFNVISRLTQIIELENALNHDQHWSEEFRGDACEGRRCRAHRMLNSHTNLRVTEDSRRSQWRGCYCVSQSAERKVRITITFFLLLCFSNFRCFRCLILQSNAQDCDQNRSSYGSTWTSFLRRHFCAANPEIIEEGFFFHHALRSHIFWDSHDLVTESHRDPIGSYSVSRSVQTLIWINSELIGLVVECFGSASLSILPETLNSSSPFLHHRLVLC